MSHTDMPEPVLHIAEDLALPLNAVTQTFAFMARRGAGKTYSASKMCEEMLGHRAQVIVLDPVGTWWGLRMLADGVTPSPYEIPVFGGLHGDLPLEPASGAFLADLVVDRGLSAVLDVSMLRKGDRKRLATEFAEELFHRAKSARAPLHLFIEEAQVFVPERVGADETRMAGAFEDIIRLGRNFGIGATLISQRPQSVNKEVLNQTECLFVLQISGAHERKAIGDWITYHSLNPRELCQDLPSLPQGTAWVWSPQWLGITKKVRIGAKRTYNASATPEVGAAPLERVQLQPLDLNQIRAAMADLVEQAEDNDPKALKRRIADLERQLSERPAAEPIRVEVPVPVIFNGDLDRLQSVAETILTEVRRVQGSPVLAPTQPVIQPPTRPAPTPTHPSTHPPIQAKPNRPDPEPENGPEARLSGPQQRILDTLATFEGLGLDHVSKSNVAVFAGQSPKSSGYDNNLSRLRTLGLISYPASKKLALTPLGKTRARAGERFRSRKDLHDAWCAQVSGPQARIIRALISYYPHALSKEDLAEQSDQSPTSSGYDNNLSALRSLGLLDYPERRQVAATALLFPEGLP